MVTLHRPRRLLNGCKTEVHHSSKQFQLLAHFTADIMVGIRRMKDDPRFGVDSRWSWITASFCAWVLFLTMATPRMCGIFFYGIVESFGVTRAEASWPVTLAGTLTVLGGPIAGYLCERFSCRAVLLVCSFLAGIGVSLCYLAESLLFLTIFFGIVQGAALCGLYVAANVLLSQHFEKRRATASSLVYAVFGFDSVLLTPVIEIVRTTYGIRGAFLIYGAILLNLIPAVIVLRSPPWLMKSRVAVTKDVHKNDASSAACVLIQPLSGDQSMAKVLSSGFPYQGKPSDCEQTTVSAAKEQRMSMHRSSFPYQKSLKLDNVKEAAVKFKLPTVSREFFTLSFFVHALSFAAIIASASVFTVIPADLAKDRGLDPSDAVYLLQAFSAADIAFRAVAGVVVDSRTLSHESIMLIGFVVQGLSYEWLVCGNTFAQLVAASVLLGATYGSRTCLQAPVLVKDFGIDILPIIMGGVLFCTGVYLLLRPLVIGYFRDTYGAYVGLLHLMAAMNALLTCVWTLKLIVRRKGKMTKLQKEDDAKLSQAFEHSNGSTVG